MSKKLKIFTESLIALLVFVLIIVFLNIHFVSGTADKFDYSVFKFNKKDPNKDIIIVALDNESINNPNFKRYQDIDREDYIKVLNPIFEGSPKVVGLDVFFFNPSENLQEDKDYSELFSLHNNLVAVNEFDFDQGKFLEPAETISIPNLQKGYANLITNSFNENVLINEAPLIFDKKNTKEIAFEPFTFRIFRALNPGDQSANFNEKDQTYEIISGDKKVKVPLQDQSVNLNFYGGDRNYKRISFFDVWSGKISPKEFKGKIVLVGATAHDIHDEFLTPVSQLDFMPGVEIHANLLQTLLDQNFVFYQTKIGKILIVFVFLSVLFLVYFFFGFLVGALSTIFLIVANYLFSILLFREFGIVYSFFWPSIAGIIFWSAIYVSRFLKAEKQKKEIRDTFSKYVAKDIVDEILKNPDKLNLGGQAKEITVFFSDLASFTSISEKLDAKSVMNLINDYLDLMSGIILENKGTIDKFIGDAIMAFWGAPLDSPDQAVLSCKAALSQQKALPDLNKKLIAKGMPKLSVRIGINTGTANIGNVGTSSKMEYTAIGDTVNLASRLEGINKEYRTNIIISEFTKEKIGDDFLVRELDLICVKGKEKPIKIFELISEAKDKTDEELNLKEKYEKALGLYRKQEWRKANEIFESLKNDKASKIMAERIKSLKNQKLSKDWSGVFTFLTK